mgnify:CR=1 FL=1
MVIFFNIDHLLDNNEKDITVEFTIQNFPRPTLLERMGMFPIS